MMYAIKSFLPSRFGRWVCIILSIYSLLLVFLVIFLSTHATVIIIWSTESELDTVGFNILRRDSTEDTFYQINENIIPASPDPIIGGDYSYKDHDVKIGQTYYYKLEDIGFDGEKNEHGPVIQVAQRNRILIFFLVINLIVNGVICVWINYRKSSLPSNSLSE